MTVLLYYLRGNSLHILIRAYHYGGIMYKMLTYSEILCLDRLYSVLIETRVDHIVDYYRTTLDPYALVPRCLIL